MKDKGRRGLPEAYVFETGKNRWRAFDEWPPKSSAREKLYLEEKGRLSFTKTAGSGAYDEFVSDPENPVPVVNYPMIWLPPEFMVQDQRFLFGRGDVLMYESEPLTEDVTVAGPIAANLWVSTTRGDADWVVKVIDVFPAEGDEQFPRLAHPPGLQHARPGRGASRTVPRWTRETPKQFSANEPTRVTVELRDVCHTFRKGHRIMVHVQSSWFPYIDRNPQRYVANIFRADTEDFVEATHRVYRAPGRESYLEIGVLREAGK